MKSVCHEILIVQQSVPMPYSGAEELNDQTDEPYWY